MKKRVRVYKPKQQMRDGGPAANNTQDSKLDPIPKQRADSFTSWLQNSAVLGAEREEQKKFEEYMKSMSGGGNAIPGYAAGGSAVPGYAAGGSPMLSPGSTLENTMKNDPYLSHWQSNVLKDQASTNAFKGDLNTLTGAGAGIMSQPDVWKMADGTVDPFASNQMEGYDTQMTGMDITGIKKDPNDEKHRTMTYNATGINKFITTPETEESNLNTDQSVNWSTWRQDPNNKNLNLDNKGVFNMEAGGSYYELPRAQGGLSVQTNPDLMRFDPGPGRVDDYVNPGVIEAPLQWPSYEPDFDFERDLYPTPDTYPPGYFDKMPNPRFNPNAEPEPFDPNNICTDCVKSDPNYRKMVEDHGIDWETLLKDGDSKSKETVPTKRYQKGEKNIFQKIFRPNKIVPGEWVDREYEYDPNEADPAAIIKVDRDRAEFQNKHLKYGGGVNGFIPRAQNGIDCPIGYKKDLQGNCVNNITGEPFMGGQESELENPGLDNPFVRKANPLTGETPMGFDSTGEKYFNEGIQIGDSVENPDLNLDTQGSLDLYKQSKFKTFDEKNPFVKGEAIHGALNAVAWLGEGDERRDNAVNFRKRASDVENIYKTAGADRGDRMANVPGFGNELKPDQHTIWGRDTKVAQDGGSMYEDGGSMQVGQEAEMSDEEIQRLLAQGYKLEYI